MTPEQMRSQVKTYLNARDAFWAPAEIYKALDSAQGMLYRMLTNADPSYSVGNTTLTIAANTTNYDLPLDARLGTKAVMVLKSGDTNQFINPIDFRRIFDGLAPPLNVLMRGRGFTFENDQLRFLSLTTGDQWIYYYVPAPCNFLQGKVRSATTTNVQFFEVVDNAINFGTPDRRDDYYNNHIVGIFSGTGAGQERTITDYTGTTSTATVDTWSITPDSNSVFYVRPRFVEEFHDLVALQAALALTPKGNKRLEDIETVLYGRGPGRPGRWHDFTGFINDRQVFVHDTREDYDLGA